jgi:ribonuclease HII
LYVCGIDEVGRGCLAGPVVTAAVILPIGTKKHFEDSKKITPLKRESDFKWITDNAYYSTTSISNEIIDKINIYQATRRAMEKAYKQLIDSIPFSYQELKYLVVDAMPLSFSKDYLHDALEIDHFPFGESASTTIAAASIVAKVTRDRLMNEMAEIFPAFSFHKHKGYGTKQHLQELASNGCTIIHRKSFLKALKFGDDHAKQQSIFE